MRILAHDPLAGKPRAAGVPTAEERDVDAQELGSGGEDLLVWSDPGRWVPLQLDESDPTAGEQHEPIGESALGGDDLDALPTGTADRQAELPLGGGFQRLGHAEEPTGSGCGDRLCAEIHSFVMSPLYRKN